MTRHRKTWSIFAALGVAAFVSCDRPSPAEPDPKGQAEAARDLERIPKLHGDVVYTLADAEALNREFPDTFWIPPKERRANLVKDDLVKLVFNLNDGEQTQRERMWVIVKGGDSSGYTGTLDNDPYSTDRIKAGLEVSFLPKHVIDIYEDESPDSEGIEGDP